MEKVTDSEVKHMLYMGNTVSKGQRHQDYFNPKVMSFPLNYLAAALPDLTDLAHLLIGSKHLGSLQPKS